MPPHFNDFVTFCSKLAADNNIPWTPVMEGALQNWLASREFRIDATDIGWVVWNLQVADKPAEWIEMKKFDISADELKKGQSARHLARMNNLLEPAFTQTTKTVPGMKNIPDEELLKLDEGKYEREFWMRFGGELMQVKKKGIDKRKESRVVAAGKKDNPSYNVWRANRHLGHRYVGAGQEFIKGGKHARTYLWLL